MEEIKSLCAKIPIELHNKVRASQEESGLTLNQYVEKLIIKYYQMKEMKNMAQNKDTCTSNIRGTLFKDKKTTLIRIQT